jgi:predicted O-methyltransferase YrrM
LQRWDVINRLLGMTVGRRFLEIGVQRGICGSKVNAREKTGVDPGALSSARRYYTKLHLKKSDDFFAELFTDQEFDVVLVDGLHHADQVLRDVDNALKHLAEGGFIVMHDCNPQSEIAQRVPRDTGVWNGDCWKAMVELRKRPNLDAFTIDSDHGIGVVQRRPNPAPLQDVSEPLNYAALDADRQHLIGLVPPSQWQERLSEEPRLGKVTVVSAVFGRRDNPAPAPSMHDVDVYVMFTDSSAPPGWRAVCMSAGADPRATARRIKTLALEHVDADIVVWIDGRIKATGKPLRPLLRHALEGVDIAGYPHPWRDCAYAEAEECGRLGRAVPSELDAQCAAYRAEGLPAKSGLWNTMVLARRRTPAMLDFGRAWWSEIERHTRRDQVSLPYLLWKYGIECGRLGNDVYRVGATPYFIRGLHVGQRTMPRSFVSKW